MPYGDGTLTAVGDGKWRLRVYAGRDARTGKERQIRRSFKGTERAARRELARLSTEVREGQVDNTTATVGQLLDAWLAQIEPTRRPTTLHGYRSRIESVIRPELGDIRLDQLAAHDLDRFYGEQLARGLSTSSVHHYHRLLSAALNQAVKWSWITSSPAQRASPPQPGRTTMKVPTPTELADLIETAQQKDPVLAVAVALAAYTGARRGELCALRWSDVDEENGQLTIARSVSIVDRQRVEGPTKTHAIRRVALGTDAVNVLRWSSERQVQLASEAAAELASNPYVLTYRADAAEGLGPSTLTHRFSKLCAGRWRFHDLRHFSVTTLIAAGVDVRTVAERHGHAQPTMTLNRYAHALPERDRAAAGVLDRAMARDA